MGDPNFYTLDEALSTIGFGKYQFYLILYGALGWVAEAMELMILSFIGPALQSEWGLSSNKESLISTAVFAGMLFGAYLWGYISDAWGRKKGFLGATTINATAGLLSAFSPNYTTLLTLRFIMGIGLGGAYLFTSWFLEFVPTTNRGRWMIIFSSFWTVGIMCEASLAWIVMPRWGWRWLLALSSTANILVLILYKFVPESPRYLCIKGRLKEAQDILQKTAQFNQTELPAGTLCYDLVLDTDEPSPEEDLHLLSTSSSKKINENKQSRSSFSTLFSRKLIRTTLLLWFLYFGNTFSYYGIVLLTSELSSWQSKCRPERLLLSNSGHSDDLYLNVFITNLAEVPGIVLSGIIVDRIGRKASMIVMFSLGFMLLVPMVAQQTGLLTIILLFGARMFISATFTVACIYCPEVYPTDVRTSGVGLTTSIGRIGGMICPLVAVGLVSNCHLAAAVVLFLTMILLSGLSVLFLPFETKGRNLSDSAILPDGR